MPLIETLAVSLGSAVARAMLKLWVKDPSIQGLSVDTTDAIAQVIPDFFDRRRTKSQFDRVADLVARKILPYYESRRGLPENEKEAAVLAVADTINSSELTAALLLDNDLRPDQLLHHYHQTNPNATRDLAPDAAGLYEFTLREACHYIVESASVLDPFGTQTNAEILQRETLILKRIKEVLDHLPSAALDDEMAFETEYLREIARTFDRLELYGLDVSERSRRYNLSVAYVTLTTQYAPPIDGEAPPPEQDLRVDEALAGHRRHLLLGSAGSGKTTLLQWLAVRCSYHDFQGILQDWNGCIPFFLQLRDYADGQMPGPEAFVTRSTPFVASLMPQRWVRQELENGRALVLIDGVDEVPESVRRKVERWLSNLIEAFPDARYVITSRPSAFPEDDWVRGTGLKQTTLQPMKVPSIHAFIEHWHKATAHGTPDEEEQQELERLCGRLQDEVASNHHVRSLAANPLLCAILCALHREGRANLPEDRMELYQTALRVLLLKRDEQKGVRKHGTPAASLTFAERELLLQHLAWWLLEREWRNAKRNQAIIEVERKLQSMARTRTKGSPDEIFRVLLVRSGVLGETGEGRVEFIHPTFQEYLGAREAMTRHEVDLLVERADRPAWHEVVVLAAGHANPRDRNELLDGLLERSRRDIDHRYQLQLLAVACLETSAEVPSRLQKELERCVRELVPPKTDADVAALASAGELAIAPLTEYRAANPHASDRVTATCIRTLARIGSERAQGALQQFTDDRRIPVIRELVRSWSSFDPEEFADQVMARSWLDNGDLDLHDPALLQATRKLPHLKRLICRFSGKLDSLEILDGIPKIIDLDVSDCPIIDLEPIRSLATPGTLRSVKLAGCSRLSDIGPLAGLSELESLDLSDCCIVRDLRPLAALRRLRHLRLRGCSRSSLDLVPLGSLSDLRILSLAGCDRLSDLSPLASLSSLRQLDLSGCGGVVDLRPLACLASLEVLGLAGCCGVADISPLLNLPVLSEVDLSGIPVDPEPLVSYGVAVTAPQTYTAPRDR